MTTSCCIAPQMIWPVDPRDQRRYPNACHYLSTPSPQLPYNDTYLSHGQPIFQDPYPFSNQQALPNTDLVGLAPPSFLSTPEFGLGTYHQQYPPFERFETISPSYIIPTFLSSPMDDQKDWSEWQAPEDAYQATYTVGIYQRS